jgi:hypothetical protein
MALEHRPNSQHAKEKTVLEIKRKEYLLQVNSLPESLGMQTFVSTFLICPGRRGFVLIIKSYLNPGGSQCKTKVFRKLYKSYTAICPLVFRVPYTA